MLSKLLKYEIKATARLFLPLYLTVAVFTLLNLFFLKTQNAADQSFSFYKLAMVISMVVFVTLMLGLVVMTLFVLIQRFYKNLLGDEGYLMFTLPVKTQTHILSKLIAATLWTLASGFVAVGAIMLVSADEINIVEFFSRLFMGFIEMTQEIGIYAYVFSIEAIVLGLLIVASTILSIYTALALGQLFNKHKMLASFGMYILLQIASQIIISLASFIFYKSGIFVPGGDFISGMALMNGLMLAAILFFAAFCAVYFCLTNYIMKRKLNLE